MPMKNPPRPHRLVKEEIEALGLSVAKAAVGLGVTRQQLHRVISGTSAISPEMAVRLEAGVGSTADAWRKTRTNFDLAEIRKRAARMNAKRVGSIEPTSQRSVEACL
jgi:addiction module HigA family antidote